MDNNDEGSLSKLKTQQREVLDMQSVAQQLYHSYSEKLEKEVEEENCWSSIVRHVRSCLELTWNQIMPIRFRNSAHPSVVKMLEKAQELPNLLAGSLEMGMKEAQATRSSFSILFYETTKPIPPPILPILQQVTQHLCLLLPHSCSSSFQITPKSSTFPLLVMCRFNIAQQLIIFATIEIEKIELNTFDLLYQSAQQQINQYILIEDTIKRQIRHSE